MRFHHLGVACRDLQQGLAQVRKLYEATWESEVVFDQHQNASLCLIKTSHGIDIELVAGEQVAGILRKGMTYYHVCFEVDDIEQEIARMSRQGALLVSRPAPALLFAGRRVAFLTTRLGLVELLE